ncbi:uncharacterized protein K441DRAFT_157179 [Cenococcum geophilum 1.58]|uniref:uncharacterized protein n=1 Tax=Cenococcum geophilum 1.58 TaxID=794803 RepID=UPI00358E5502|nr:hypothetical protein K441DRAFT_157179 [Cenococcum geophilum 1.58]
MFAFKIAALGLAFVSLVGAFPNIAPRASSRSECPAAPTAVMTVTLVPEWCTSSGYIFSSTPAPVTSSAAASASPEAPVQSSAPAQSVASTPETPIVSATSTGAVESSAAPSKPALTVVNTSVGPTQSQAQPSIPVTTTNSGSMMQFNAAMAGVIAAGALAALV